MMSNALITVVALGLVFLTTVRTSSVDAFSHSSSVNPPSRVLVTGAAGRTGRLVFEQLIAHDKFDPVALVRSENSGRKLIRDSEHCGLEQIVVCDVVKDLEDDGLLQVPEGLEGTVDSMIICTSAVPVLSKASLFRAVVRAPLNVWRGQAALDFRSFRFKFKKNQYPEMVDYRGQVAQIELAKKLGIKKVVVVSSMGGTDPDNFLNNVGKKPDGSGHGDILLWKRKAEQYLIESGLSYTIIHPGGLVDTVDPNVEEEIVIDVNDKLMESSSKRSISRAHVASLCVAALADSRATNTSIDCISRVVRDTPKSAEDVLAQFLTSGVTANYAV